MNIPKAKKLPSGSWHIQLRINGQSISVTKQTEKEAVAEAAAIKAGLVQVADQPQRITLAEAYRRYIDAREGSLSPSTIAGYRRLSRNTFQPLMGYQLCSLSNELIQHQISVMSRSGKSPKYISNASGLLSSVLRMYSPDFNYHVFLPHKEIHNDRLPSDQQIGDILDAVAGTDIELPVLMAVWMGMRMSEIRGARYGDIKDGKLHIVRAIVDDEDGKPVVKATKTAAGRRYVDLPPQIEKLMPGGSPDEYIVRRSGQAIYKRFSRVLEAAGLPHIRFHDLRHVNAAVMLRLGVDSKYAQARNGWSSDRMYKQVYAYTMPDRMRTVDDVINSYFSQKIANGNANDKS